MPPRNLTFEEICFDKENELIELKLKGIRITMELRDLNSEKQFTEETTLKFIDKIMQIRIRYNILPLQTTSDIEMYRCEVERLEDKVDNLSSKIQQLERKRADVNRRINDFQDAFRRFKVNKK